MHHAAERLNNVVQIKRYLNNLERIGLWKPINIPDQTTIDDQRDEILRILNLIETELERAGLWDRSTDVDDKGPEADQTTVSLEQISKYADDACKIIRSHKAGK